MLKVRHCRCPILPMHHTTCTRETSPVKHDVNHQVQSAEAHADKFRIVCFVGEQEIVATKALQLKAVVGIWPASAKGDDIQVRNCHFARQLSCLPTNQKLPSSA